MSAKSDRPGKRSGKASARPHLLRNWSILLAIVVGIWAVFFGIPALVKNLKAPPIAEDFGLEDAVVALRLYADDTAYLVLVDENGSTRSVQLEERGFEDSRLVWSDAGLSTGGPTDEFIVRADGLSRIPVPVDPDSASDRSRFATDDGFVVYTGSAQGQLVTFIDAASDRVTSIDPGYTGATLADCGGEVFLVGEGGPRAITATTTDFDGLGLFDDVESLVCDQGHLYGLGEIDSEGDTSHQALRVWDRTDGTMVEREIRYPDDVLGWRSGSPFIREGRLHWAAGFSLWSIPLTSSDDVIDAEETADLSWFDDGLSPVVGTDDGILATAGDRVFGVAEDDEFVNPRRGPSFDRLLDLAIFSTDISTGETRIEIDIDGIDFPKKDLHVTAIAVNPDWASAR